MKSEQCSDVVPCCSSNPRARRDRFRTSVQRKGTMTAINVHVPGLGMVLVVTIWSAVCHASVAHIACASYKRPVVCASLAVRLAKSLWVLELAFKV